MECIGYEKCEKSVLRRKRFVERMQVLATAHITTDEIMELTLREAIGFQFWNKIGACHEKRRNTSVSRFA
jgi:hypothetical protein